MIVKEDQFGKALEGAVFSFTGDGIDDQTNLISKKKDGEGAAIVVEDIEVPLGEYVLSETHTPEGYNTLPGDITISVEPGDVDNDVIVTAKIKGEEDTAHAKLTRDIHSENKTWILTVVNDAGVSLPSTGGSGTHMFYFLGAMLTAVALALLARRRKA